MVNILIFILLFGVVPYTRIPRDGVVQGLHLVEALQRRYLGVHSSLLFAFDGVVDGQTAACVEFKGMGCGRSRRRGLIEWESRGWCSHRLSSLAMVAIAHPRLL